MNETLRLRRGHNFLPPKSVKVPALRSTDGITLADQIVVLHYFSPSSDWWLTELDPATAEAFGFCCLNGDRDCAEWGYVSLPELERLYVPPWIIVERDCHWQPKSFREAVPWS
ncbi:MAG: DUF2958 domain-containing protein [Candidatus Dormiibacterota bacterium]